MPTPNTGVDFFQLKLKINYNNDVNPFLQYGTPGSSTPKPPQEFQAGWDEIYDMDINRGYNTNLTNGFVLCAARASVLALNYYIKSATLHQASVFGSAWPMAGSARFPCIDSNYLATGLIEQQTSAPEESIIIRQESTALRRWERQYRGIKDYLSDDAMSQFPALSWNLGATTTFDSISITPQNPATVAGTQASILVQPAAGYVVTNTAGVLGPVATPTAPNVAGLYPAAVPGVYPLSIYDAGGAGGGAYGTFTINGSNVVSSFTLTNGGSGYVKPVVVAPLSADTLGLAMYQTPATYWANFCNCVLAFTGSGTHIRLANANYTPKTSFPKGYGTSLVAYIPTQRIIIQRIGNRQTGKLRLTSPARRKRAK